MIFESARCLCLGIQQIITRSVQMSIQIWRPMSIVLKIHKYNELEKLLPAKDIWCYILGYTDIPTLGNFSKCCKFGKEIFENNLSWCNLYVNLREDNAITLDYKKEMKEFWMRGWTVFLVGGTRKAKFYESDNNHKRHEFYFENKLYTYSPDLARAMMGDPGNQLWNLVTCYDKNIFLIKDPKTGSLSTYSHYFNTRNFGIFSFIGDTYEYKYGYGYGYEFEYGHKPHVYYG